jgi:CheY-like chemotaxis protein
VASPVVVAVPDLLLQSRIAEAARRAGVRFVIADTPDDVLRLARAERPGLLVLDLDSPRVQAEATLRRVRGDPALSGLATLGFYSHVRTELAERAKQAGCDRLLTRGQFVRQVDALLRPYA